MLALPARGFWAVRAERRSSPGDQVSRSGPGEEPGAPGWGGGGGEDYASGNRSTSSSAPALAPPQPGQRRRGQGERSGAGLAHARRPRAAPSSPQPAGGAAAGSAAPAPLGPGGSERGGGVGAALGPARPPPPFVPSPRRRRWSRRAPSLLFRWGSPSCRDSAPALPPAAERDPARAKGASRRSAAAGR